MFETAHEERGAAVGKTRLMSACTVAFCDEVDNNSESDAIEADTRLFNDIKIPLNAFVTRAEVMTRIADEIKKGTAAMMTD